MGNNIHRTLLIESTIDNKMTMVEQLKVRVAFTKGKGPNVKCEQEKSHGG